MPGRNSADFLSMAEATIEQWAQSSHSAWADHVWIEKMPKADGNFGERRWITEATSIVDAFNARIAPTAIGMSRAQKVGSHTKKLKVLRKFLTEQAVAAQATTTAKELLP